MHSLQTKTTLLTVGVILITILVATIVGVVAVKNIGNSSSEQMLLLLCETGEKNLDLFFESVEQSVDMVSTFVTADLALADLDHLADHITRTEEIFIKTANKTHGVLTFYYRIDPAISTTDKGFWYIDTTGNGFESHEVTDISLYDTADTSALVWFTVPKATGKAIWLPSYVTDNLDVRVISYNVPVYKGTQFIGVIGIEIDYTTMAETVKSIQLYDSGYAFVSNADGDIVYHPVVDVLALADEDKLVVPDGLYEDQTIVHYRYNGVEKMAAWMPLRNGMRLTVCVPLSEINGNWRHFITEILIAVLILLVVFVVTTALLTRHFTKPLRALTTAAEQVNEGNYDIQLNYKGNDEIGILSDTVNHLIEHLRGYIADLNSLAYGDALTSVRNKGAFDVHVRELQSRLDGSDDQVEFAIGIFDCDNLKTINDRYGHDKGDMYLKNSSHLICRVFQSSSVFRIGGDEFAAILLKEDYVRREELVRYFFAKSAEISAFAKGPWEEVHVAVGVAAFDPAVDHSVEDVIRRADQLMYDNKKARK